MKRFADFIVSLTLVLSVATSILYTISLHRILKKIREHDQSILDHTESQEYVQEMMLNNKEVALNFSNDFLEISEDKEWESIQLKVLPVDSASGNAYITAMHQEIYCLDTVRKAYLSYHLPRPRFTAAFYLEAEMCLEQLKQITLCNADTTLEPTRLARAKDGTIQPSSSGIGVLHRCRDWRMLTQSNGEDNEEGI